MTGGNFTAEQFIKAIPSSGGIISTIARRVGCNWHTAKKYIEHYPTVKQAYEDECETVLDVAEMVVMDGLREKDIQTAKWYLTLKGKQRGYTERHEITGADGEGLIIRVIGGDPEKL